MKILRDTRRWSILFLLTVFAFTEGAIGQTQNLVPIPIELPKPGFGGTPENLPRTNLEKPSKRGPFLAPAGVVNVAKGKKVTSSDKEAAAEDLEMITDGDKTQVEGNYIELGPGVQSVTVDLGSMNEVYAVLFWHFPTPRVYFGVVVQSADDAAFTKNVQTLFSNDLENKTGTGIGKDMNYIENFQGKLVDAKGVRARYVRLYSNGNNSNALNHYIEVEVFGRPAK